MPQTILQSIRSPGSWRGVKAFGRNLRAPVASDGVGSIEDEECRLRLTDDTDDNSATSSADDQHVEIDVVSFRYQHCRRAADNRSHVSCCVALTASTIVVAGLVVVCFLLFAHIGGKNVRQEAEIKRFGCDEIDVRTVWVAGFPKLMTESAFRLLDVNGDNVLDVIVGFATGAEGYNVPEVVCDIYFDGSKPCLGGVMALDGSTGRQLWRHYTPHEIYAVNCDRDLNQDSISDCIIAGRVATFEAVNSRNGHLLWSFRDETVTLPDVMNFYTGQFIDDIDDDSFPDIVAVHGGDPFAQPGSLTRLPGKVYVVSGRNGHVISGGFVPDSRESYYSPVVFKQLGKDMVLYGTGGETHPGSLWVVALQDLARGKIDKSVPIYTNRYKGIMTPPVLIDLTSDGTVDIVFAAYNSSVIALDGITYAQIWNYTYPLSETYATPAPGFFNNDSVPDFLVHWQYGPGFPVYYHSMTTVIDGRNGRVLLEQGIKSSVGAQTSPLTVSVEGFGNDIFLYWNADCNEHEGEGGQFDFVKGTNMYDKSRSDFCRLRFKTSGFSRLYALSSHLRPPGTVLYDSREQYETEHRWAVDTGAEAMKFLLKHPEQYDDYQRWMQHLHDHNLDDGDDDTFVPSSTSAEASLSSSHRDQQLDVAKSTALANASRDRDARGSIEDQRQCLRCRPLRSLVNDRNRKFRQGRRPVRHVGPHDQGGVQRLISTGTLAPPLNDGNHPVNTAANVSDGIDLIYGTYWFYPAKTKVVLDADQRCVFVKLANQQERYDPRSEYFGLDEDAYERRVTEKCLDQSGHQPAEHSTYQSLNTYTPYTIKMGQLTVYRVRISCKCTRTPSGGHCGRIRSFERQQWSAYMGSHANSHWIPLT